jgi:predicted glycoside hydrolase/deacetylase ChbG (UPF0249 family)
MFCRGKIFVKMTDSRRYVFNALLIWAFICMIGNTLASDVTFAERLGWKANDVVVILHVDDVGMSHSSNRGAIESIENGVASSFSIMMPCPWVPEIARYLKAHPDVDAGLHLTLTSEWQLYRWGPISGKAQAPGLVDDEGCLWRSVEQVAAKATPDEIEREIRAQIDRAETLGIPITHLDSHMGTLFARPDYFERFAKVGMEKRIPVLCVGGHMTYVSQENKEAATQLRPWVKKIWNAGLPVLDDLLTGFTSFKPEEKPGKLMTLLAELKPGVTEVLFHASLPTEEFPLITGSSEARRADLKALTNPRVKQLIQERGIFLTTWKELKERRKKAAAME